jgi:hypothetical protein
MSAEAKKEKIEKDEKEDAVRLRRGGHSLSVPESREKMYHKAFTGANRRAVAL